MRKGFVAGLSGVLCVAAISSCGKDEENPVIEIPEAVFSASTALALRVTGPYGPNDGNVVEALGGMLNDELDFADVVMRGGMPSGSLEGDPAGSAPAQVKAFLDAGQFLAPEDAVDLCGNPMLAAFVTPDLLTEIYEGTGTDPTNLGLWPGVCGDDAGCDTTSTGKFEVGFSKDHGDGHRDLVVVVSPSAGATTTPGFTGHLVGTMLTANNTGNHLLAAPLYGNMRSVTVSAFGLVKFAKAGVSTRPTLPLPGMPTRVWAFPAEERELKGADLIVGVQPWEFCARSWATAFAGAAEPVGCDKQKALVLDISSGTAKTLFEERADSGDDLEGLQALEGDLDDWIKAFEYQLKAQIACPDVSEPNWIRRDIALGSVEVFQCPDGDIDRCIAFHDMEDFYCEGGIGILEPTELVAILPLIEGTDAGPFDGEFEDPDGGGPQTQTFRYSANGTDYTLVWELERTDVGTPDPLFTLAEVVTHLNAIELDRAGSSANVNVVFSAGTSGIVVEPDRDLGPNASIAMGAGSVNSKIGLGSGSASIVNPAIPAAAETPYFITSENAEDVGVAYVRINGSPTEPTVIYTDEPGRVLGLYNSAGNSLPLPAPRTDIHCTNRGAKAFEITGTGALYLQLDLVSDGSDEMQLLSASVPAYIQ